MTKITIERETLEMALAALGEYERHYGWRIGPTVELRAALAQKAEPDEQEVALQEIAEFGQDQLREPRTQEEKEQYAFEDWLASECPSGDVESVQRQWEESAEYLELQDATPAQPADAQPTGQSPCARHCEAPAFEGEIRRLKREATIKDSLTIRPPAPAAVPPGYVLVPIEPTPEMVDAGDVARHSVLTQARTSVIYRAMIAAAKRVAP